jgi:hypothetical protein
MNSIFLLLSHYTIYCADESAASKDSYNNTPVCPGGFSYVEDDNEDEAND